MLILSCENSDDGDDGVTYGRLRGEIRLEGGLLDDDDEWFPPYATSTQFSFSSADTVEVSSNMISATALLEDGEEGTPFARVDTLFPDNTTNKKTMTGGLPLRYEVGDSKITVTLRWSGQRRGLDWLPHDTYGETGRDYCSVRSQHFIRDDTIPEAQENQHYARAIREKIQQRKRVPPDYWTKSWLHRQMSLPGPIVRKICEYNVFLPETEQFWIEPNDLSVLINMSNDEYTESDFDMLVVARKRE